MIEATLQLAPNSRTARGSAWIATCTVDGTTHTARSRSAALHALARALVTNNVPDQPLVATQEGLRGTITYGSIYGMAKWTYKEGNRPLQRVHYTPHPAEIAAGGGGKG